MSADPGFAPGVIAAFVFFGSFAALFLFNALFGRRSGDSARELYLRNRRDGRGH